jgi:hypothetical protein
MFDVLIGVEPGNRRAARNAKDELIAGGNQRAQIGAAATDSLVAV